ncbi:MAG: ABC transporter permease, partial [Myxococcota bacterium]
VLLCTNPEQAKRWLTQRKVSAVLRLPSRMERLLQPESLTKTDASESLPRDRAPQHGSKPPKAQKTDTEDSKKSSKDAFGLWGDFNHPHYAQSAFIVQRVLLRFMQKATGTGYPFAIQPQALAGSDRRTAFENYVPGLLILSVVMLLFSASMTMTYEVETGTLRRLQLSQISAFSLLSGLSLVQVLLGGLSVLLTFGVAWMLGFRSQGSILLAMLVAILTSFSVMGIGMVIAAFAQTVMEAFLFSNVPLFLLMFFSGAMRPIPKVPLLQWQGFELGLYDLLQPTHAVVALNKILSLGAGIQEIAFELVALSVLSALYLTFGIAIFQKRRMDIG